MIESVYITLFIILILGFLISMYIPIFATSEKTKTFSSKLTYASIISVFCLMAIFVVHALAINIYTDSKNTASMVAAADTETLTVAEYSRSNDTVTLKTPDGKSVTFERDTTERFDTVNAAVEGDVVYYKIYDKLVPGTSPLDLVTTDAAVIVSVSNK